MNVRQLRLLAAMFVCVAMITLMPNMAKAVIIIDQNVDGNVGGWSGWGGDLPPTHALITSSNFGDEDPGVGGPTDQLPLEAINGNMPYANGGATPTVTYGAGLVQVGTYNVTVQMLNWNNAGFPAPISATFMGLTPASSGANPAPGLGEDEIWTYSFNVTGAEAGSPLTMAFNAGGLPGENFGIDHIQIDGPALIPPPPPFTPPAGSVPVGNDLTNRDAATDGGTVIFNTNYEQMPGAGTVGSVGVYTQGSSGYSFEVLQLRPTGNADEYEVIYNSGPNTTSGTSGEVEHFEFANGPTAVLAGDIFAHYGRGIPFSSAGGMNANNAHPIFHPTAVVPGLGDILTLSDTVGTPPAVPINASLSRDYALAVNFEPIPEPSSMILIILGLCSLGFWKLKK